MALLPRDVAGAVVLAYRRRQEALVGVGSGQEPRSSNPRRFIMKDGTARMHPQKGDPDLVGPEGPGDPEVGVLWATSPDGQLLTAVVNYSSHSIVVGHEEAFSADYPGYIARTVNAVKGAQAPVLFVNGACGNTCPIDVYDLKHREYGYEWAERVGNMVGGEALRVMARRDVAADLRVRVASETVELGIRRPTEEALAAARKLLADSASASIYEITYAGEILLLDEEIKQEPAATAEIQVIALGDAAFVGIPAELFVEYGLEIKQHSPFAHTYVAELANGWIGYVPTPEAHRRGGYETQLARSSKVVPEAGGQLVGTALKLLESLR